MNEQQRLEAFRHVLSAASNQYGVRIAIVQQIGNVVLDEPSLGYVFVAEQAQGEETEAAETECAFD